MNKIKLVWTVADIERMYRDRKVLSFEYPIQRESEMWNNVRKSLLIHSMLANYPVPNVYVLRKDSEQTDEQGRPVFNYYVLDGKQRLTSVLSYIRGEFPLEDTFPGILVRVQSMRLRESTSAIWTRLCSLKSGGISLRSLPLRDAAAGRQRKYSSG